MKKKQIKKKLYIGCSLTLLPPNQKEEFLQMISEIKKELGKSFEILEFLGIGDIVSVRPFTPKEIYDYDIRK